MPLIALSLLCSGKEWKEKKKKKACAVGEERNVTKFKNRDKVGVQKAAGSVTKTCYIKEIPHILHLDRRKDALGQDPTT